MNIYLLRLLLVCVVISSCSREEPKCWQCSTNVPATSFQPERNITICEKDKPTKYKDTDGNTYTLNCHQ